MSSLNFKQGDVVVAPVPFSNQATAKLRPALVMSPQDVNARSDDLVVFKITSKGRDYPFEVLLTEADVQNGKLKQESVVQIDFPVVIEQQAVKERVGNITSEKLAQVKQKTRSFYQL